MYKKSFFIAGGMMIAIIALALIVENKVSSEEVNTCSDDYNIMLNNSTMDRPIMKDLDEDHNRRILEPYYYGQENSQD